MVPMISPRIKPYGLFPEEAPDDMFVLKQRKVKLKGADAGADGRTERLACAVDIARPRADRSKGVRHRIY